MTSEKRVFLALTLDDQTKAEIFGRLETIYNQCAGELRLVPQRNYHITLHFLGNVRVEKIEEIERQLPEVLSDCKPFMGWITQPGWFVAKGVPRVFWCGVYADGASELHQLTGSRLAALGFPTGQQSFKAHITWARSRGGRPHRTCSLVETLHWNPLPVQFRQVALFESKLGKGAPVYVPLQKVVLKRGR